MIDALRRDLPNFPDEILFSWLAPAAKERGWPPTILGDGLPDSRWRALFRNKPLSAWKGIGWEKRKVQISPNSLNESSISNISGIFEAAVLLQQNCYSEGIRDLIPRFENVIKFITTNGVLPVPPILIEEGEKFDVVDGNHRLAAFFFCHGFFKIDPPREVRERLQSIQSFWIGKPDS